MSGLQIAIKGRGIIQLVKELRETEVISLTEAKKRAEDVMIALGYGLRDANGYYKSKWRKMYLHKITNKAYAYPPTDGSYTEIMVENS